MKLQISMTLPSGERQTRTLDPDLLGPGDDTACRKATGLPVSAFIDEDTFGSDSVLVVWWIAGRQAGRHERYQRVVQTWPTIADLQRADPDIEYLEDDSPEG
ncbi:MAG TPA: hypothetical protein ENI86_09300 [Acidimicrobiales bacterium]|nr:hypothetical protein [Acidimicrobiales bacterium]